MANQKSRFYLRKFGKSLLLNPKCWMVLSITGFFSFCIFWFSTRCNPIGSISHTDDLHDLLGRQKRLLETIQSLKRQVDEKDLPQNVPTIYAITPTYKRFTQKADLTRLSQTFMHIPKFHWIIVEDSETKTDLVTKLLKRKKLKYTHLCVKTQSKLARKENDPQWVKHRGVDQRNLGIKWIRENVKDSNGVVYLADDDNTYDLNLFKEMRNTKKVSIWPVALVGGLRWEGPICVHGKVIEFFTAWEPSREFPVDMAAFAINLKVILEYPSVYINPDSRRGYLETDFLKALEIKQEDMEAKADNCRTILVWHTKTAEAKMKQEKRLYALGMGSDSSIEI